MFTIHPRASSGGNHGLLKHQVYQMPKWQEAQPQGTPQLLFSHFLLCLITADSERHLYSIIYKIIPLKTSRAKLLGTEKHCLQALRSRLPGLFKNTTWNRTPLEIRTSFLAQASHHPKGSQKIKGLRHHPSLVVYCQQMERVEQEISEVKSKLESTQVP